MEVLWCYNRIFAKLLRYKKIGGKIVGSNDLKEIQVAASKKATKATLLIKRGQKLGDDCNYKICNCNHILQKA